MHLPNELEEQFEQRFKTPPQLVLRALTDLLGNLGETYVAAVPAGLMLFSKRLGGKTEPVELAPDDLAGARVREGRPFCFFEVPGHQPPVYLKFSAMDEEQLQQLLKLVAPAAAATAAPKPTPAAAGPEATAPLPAPATAPAAATAAPATSGPPPTAEIPPLNPTTIFCACVLQMAGADGTLDAEERRQVFRLFSPEVVTQGDLCLQHYGLDRVLAETRGLTADQKLCLLANLLEVAMSDGVLRSTERALIKRFRETAGVADENYQAIYDVLVVKNNLTVFLGPA